MRRFVFSCGCIIKNVEPPDETKTRLKALFDDVLTGLMEVRIADIPVEVTEEKHENAIRLY